VELQRKLTLLLVGWVVFTLRGEVVGGEAARLAGETAQVPANIRRSINKRLHGF
jgi:hypothetical protein